MNTRCDELYAERLEKRIQMAITEFHPLSEIPLKSIMDRLGISDEKEANRRAALFTLPFPVYRHGSQRSAYYVSVLDFATYLANKQEQALDQLNSTAA